MRGTHMSGHTRVRGAYGGLLIQCPVWAGLCRLQLFHRAVHQEPLLRQGLQRFVVFEGTWIACDRITRGASMPLHQLKSGRRAGSLDRTSACTRHSIRPGSIADRTRTVIRKHILADRDRARASARSKEAVSSSDRTLAAVVISPRQYRYARDRLASGSGSTRASPRDRWVFAQSPEQARRDNAVTRAALHDSLLNGMVAAVEDDAVTVLDLDEHND